MWKGADRRRSPAADELGAQGGEKEDFYTPPRLLLSARDKPPSTVAGDALLQFLFPAVISPAGEGRGARVPTLFSFNPRPAILPSSPKVFLLRCTSPFLPFLFFAPHCSSPFPSFFKMSCSSPFSSAAVSAAPPPPPPRSWSHFRFFPPPSTPPAPRKEALRLL